jgi:HSP20 family protein
MKRRAPAAFRRSAWKEVTKQEKEEKGKKFHKIEREYGKFVRRFALPTEVDGTKVQAEFKEGVLSVHLPKSAKALPKHIEVKVA